MKIHYMLFYKSYLVMNCIWRSTTSKIVYFLVSDVKRCSGAVEDPEGNNTLFTGCRWAVMDAEGHEAKKTACLHVCVCLPWKISGRRMIPMSGIPLGGNSGEINTSVFGKGRVWKRLKTGQNHKMSLVSPSLKQSVSRLLTLQPFPEQH